MTRQEAITRQDGVLELRPGEWAEVRSKDEILATLDKNGRHRGMPFMPEMLAYCGKRFRVSKRAEKSCDTIYQTGGRKVVDVVHLEGVRCDGSAHGGCQALCLIWWHEAWLRRAIEHEDQRRTTAVSEGPVTCAEEDLHRATRRPRFISATLYSCQATNMLDFSSPMKWWDPRGVAREIKRGNVEWQQAIRVVASAAANVLRRRFGRKPKPHINGRCEGRTPSARLPGLRPGDWVVVKSKEEIEATLNRRQMNRGLFFDIEMLPYCGRRMRLLKKVEKIIDEKTGAMMALPNDCWIIEGAVCQGLQSRGRLFCTRQIYPYWREIWLKRPDDDETSTP